MPTTGVCRDYMHLAITFCRRYIPARIQRLSGDIGVPLPVPDGFQRLVRGLLGGQWYASMRGTLFRALKLYHCPPRKPRTRALKSIGYGATGTPMSPR